MPEFAADSSGLEFYSDARRYDLITGALSGSGPVNFYRERAVRYRSSVLELATGTGRLAIPVALEGVDVTGLDASTEMLAAAEQKANGSGAVIARVHGDMRSFAFPQRFRLSSLRAILFPTYTADPMLRRVSGACEIISLPVADSPSMCLILRLAFSGGSKAPELCCQVSRRLRSGERGV